MKEGGEKADGYALLAQPQAITIASLLNMEKKRKKAEKIKNA